MAQSASSSMPRYLVSRGWEILPVALFAVAISCWYHFHKIGFIPPVGVYIAIAGLMAAVMTLRSEPTKLEKAVWILLLALMTAAEIRNIYTADAKQTAEFGRITSSLSDTVAALNATKDGLTATSEGITATASKLDTSIAASQKQFDITMGKITGGPSYAVVIPTMNHDPNTKFGLKIQLGKHSARNSVIEASVYLREGNRISDNKYMMFSLVSLRPIFTGSIDPGYVRAIGSAGISPQSSQLTEYTIDMFARNGPTREILQVRPLNSGSAWEYSYKIFRKEKVIEKSDPEWTLVVFMTGINK
jgi:hypothetical protein